MYRQIDLLKIGGREGAATGDSSTWVSCISTPLERRGTEYILKAISIAKKALEHKDSVFLWRKGKVFILQYNKDSLPLGKVQADLFAVHYKRYGSPKLSFLSSDATSYVSSIFLGDFVVSCGTQGQVTDMTMKLRLFALQ